MTSESVQILYRDGERARIALENDSVVAAARRQGVALAYNCQLGRCRTCTARAVSGEAVLLCQTSAERPASYTVDYARADIVKPARRKVRVNEVRRLAPSVVALTFRLQAPMRFRPGQYFKVSFGPLPGHRYFSPASRHQDSEHRLLIRILPNGAFSGYVANALQPNELFQVEGPYGRFHLRDARGRLLFVAGGTGLAPIYAMLCELASDRYSERIDLVFGVRSSSDVFFLDELAALAERLDLHVHVCVDEGSPGSHFVGNVAARLGRGDLELGAVAAAYLCGPPRMVDACRSILESSGLPADSTFAEEFIAS